MTDLNTILDAVNAATDETINAAITELDNAELINTGDYITRNNPNPTNRHMIFHFAAKLHAQERVAFGRGGVLLIADGYCQIFLAA